MRSPTSASETAATRMQHKENKFDLGRARSFSRPSGGRIEERRIEASREHRAGSQSGSTVVVCLEGQGTVVVGRETFLARTGCIAVLSDGATADLSAGPGGLRILVVHWAPSALAPLGPIRDGLERTRVLYGRASVGLAWRIVDEMRLGDALGPWAMDVMANGMAVALTRGIRAHPPVSPLAARARRTIEQQGYGLMSLAAIARQLGCTPEHLSRVFRRSYGMTPSRFAMWRRVEQAKRRLLGGSRSVGDIAVDLGFRDTSHFARHFRSWTGVSPGAFRARVSVD
jgi:AraC-like DNA-binding protein